MTDQNHDDKTERNLKKVQSKTAWAEKKRRTLADLQPQDPARVRLPPGQTWANRGWPVLDLGDQPLIAAKDWQLAVDGAVQNPLSLTFDDFMDLPHVEIERDFHCVTTWSTQDNRWSGVRFSELMDRVLPADDATHVMLTGFDRAPDTGEFYTTNLTLKDCLEDEVMLVHAWNGEPLSREHGGPVRLMVPKLYAWKSAKWLKGITLMTADAPGYWEVRGYSMTARPWDNDRFSRGPSNS
ncbi:MAG: sulfite oxidase-like oxidoreductase [Planctomycetota bacterium]